MKLLIPVSLAAYDCIIIKGQGRKKPRRLTVFTNRMISWNRINMAFNAIHSSTLCREQLYVTFVMWHLSWVTWLIVAGRTYIRHQLYWVSHWMWSRPSVGPNHPLLLEWTFTSSYYIILHLASQLLHSRQKLIRKA